MARGMHIDAVNNMARTPELFIRQCEEAFQKEVSRLAERICEKNLRFVYISGPTSSGKTTFANTLFHYIQNRELVPISLDNFFCPQETIKPKKDGTKDFESIKTIDLPKYRKIIRQIQAVEPFSLPYFDFEKRQIVDNHTTILPKENAVYIIEGLHALNDKICGLTPKEDSIKVYVSPHGQILNRNGKPYNRNDFRFLRRMIRDNYYRSAPPEMTFQMWPGVRSGEKRYSYRKKADLLIDTFLFYEPCVLRKQGLQLLSSMENRNQKATRLMHILEQFTPIDTKWIPETSILNEFLKKCR